MFPSNAFLRMLHSGERDEAPRATLDRDEAPRGAKEEGGEEGAEEPQQEMPPEASVR